MQGQHNGETIPVNALGSGRAAISVIVSRSDWVIIGGMDGYIACHACDLLVDVSQLEDGSAADCPRCGGFLTRYKRDANERIVAYTVTSIILLVLAFSFPFLSFAASGLESVMTLPQTPAMLWTYGQQEVALLVAAFIIVIPAVVLALLLAVCLPLQRGHGHRWLRQSAHMLFELYNWAMVEVFIIGVIVSLVKIAAMADVSLGISFWAYTGFAITFTLALANLDRYQCWRDIERVSSAAA